MYALYGTLFPEVAVKFVFKVEQYGNTQVQKIMLRVRIEVIVLVSRSAIFQAKIV